MSRRVIHIKLNPSDIESAVRDLKAYRKWLTKKTDEFLKALAREGMEIAAAKFRQAEYDGTNDVSVSVEERGQNKAAVVAVGGAVLFIEFGTGIRYNEAHPEAAGHGMLRGEYGHKLGRLKNGWRYTGEPGTNGEVITEGKHAGEVHTYGNPASMSMYLTVRELEEKFAEIARRVYV